MVGTLINVRFSPKESKRYFLVITCSDRMFTTSNTEKKIPIEEPDLALIL